MVEGHLGSMYIDIHAVDKFSGTLKSYGHQIAKIGDTLTKYVTLPLIALGAIGIREFMQQERAIGQMNAVLKSTGGVANVTGKHLQGMAEKLMMLSGADDEAIMAGSNMLLTFTKIRNETGKGNDIFDQATKATLNMATAMNNGAAPSAEQMKMRSIQLGKALQDPVLGLTALRKVGVNFSKEQKEMVKGWVEHGELLKAQKFILAELNTEFGESAKAAGKTLPGQLNILKEVFTNAMGSIIADSKILPAITSIFKDIAFWARDTAKAFGELSPETRETIVKFVGLIILLGPILSIFGRLMSAASSLVGVFSFLKGGVAGVSAALGSAGPAGWVVWAVLAAIAAIGVVVYRNWKDIVRIFKDAYEVTGTSLSPAIAALKDAFNDLAKALKPAYDAISPFLPTFADLGKALGGTLLVGLMAFGMTLVIVITILASFVKAIAGTAETVIGFSELLVGFATGDADAMEAGYDKIGNGFSTVGEAAKLATVDLANNLGKMVTGMDTALNKWNSDSDTNAAKLKGKNLGTSVAQGFDEGLLADIGPNKSLRGKAASLTAGAENLPKTPGGEANNAAGTGGAMTPVAGGGLAASWTERGKQAIAGFAVGVLAGYDSLKLAVAIKLQGYWNIVTGTFDRVTTWVKTSVSSIPGAVANAYNSAVANIAQILNTMYSTVIGWFSRIYLAISGWLANTYSVIVSTWTGAVNTVRTILLGYYNSVVTWFTNIWNSASLLVMNLGNTLRNAWNAIGIFVGNLITQAKLKMSQFLTYMGTVPKLMYDTLIAGLGWMVEAGKNLGQRLIQAVKDILGIRSPSAAFQTIGQQMITGLLKGLTFDQVKQVLESNFGGLEGLAMELFSFISGNLGKGFDWINQVFGIDMSALWEYLLNMFGGGGGGGEAAGGSMGAEIFNYIQRVIPGNQIASSLGRPGSITTSGNTSLHASGRAADIVGANLDAVAVEGGKLIGAPGYSSGVGKTGFGEVFWKTMAGGNHFTHVHIGAKSISPYMRSVGFGSAGGAGKAGMTPAMGLVGGGNIQQMISNAATARGWGGQLAQLMALIQRESGFNPAAKNPRSTAYGLFQMLTERNPNPAVQIQNGLGYIASRYGNPANAWNFWQGHRWYKGGGEVQATLHTGERVLTEQQNRWFSGISNPLNNMLTSEEATSKISGNGNVAVQFPTGTTFKIKDLYEGIIEVVEEGVYKHVVNESNIKDWVK